MSWLTEFVRPKIRNLFARREVPENLWHQCPSCEQMIFQRDLATNLKVCPHCAYHMRASALERLAWTFDEDEGIGAGGGDGDGCTPIAGGFHDPCSACGLG